MQFFPQHLQLCPQTMAVIQRCMSGHLHHQRVACCSVTLGDEQAKKRGVQKSVRERAGPPTFECCIEMEDRQHWNIYEDVASATDALLAGAGSPSCASVDSG